MTMKRIGLVMVLVLAVTNMGTAALPAETSGWHFGESSDPSTDYADSNPFYWEPNDNALSSVTGISGNATSIDTGEFLWAEYNPNMNMTGGDGTVAIWFKTTTLYSVDTTDFATLVEKGASTATGSSGKVDYRMTLDDRVVGHVDDGSTAAFPLIQSPGYDDGQWHFAALTVNSSDACVYYDGQFSCADASGIGDRTNTDSLDIARTTESYNGSTETIVYDGAVDEARLFTGDDLSRSQLDELMTVTSAIPPVFNSTSTTPDPWKFLDTPDVTANVTDSDGTVSSVTADVTEGGAIIHQDVALTEQANGNWSVSDLFTVDETDVYYNVTLTATDNDGATATTEIAQFIANNRPGISIGQPVNKTYEGTSVDYAVTINNDSDDVENEQVNLTLFNDEVPFRSLTTNEADNNTFTGTINVTDGLHNFTAIGNETGIVLNQGGQNPTTVTDPVSNSTFYTTESTVAQLVGFQYVGQDSVDRNTIQWWEDGIRVVLIGLLVAIVIIGGLSAGTRY